MEIKKSKYDVIINILSVLCILGTIAYLLYTWDKIPNKIPGHYNTFGEIDRITDKNSTIKLVALTLVIYAVISIIEKFPLSWNTGVQITPLNKEKVYRTLKTMLETAKFTTTLLFTFLTIYSTTCKNLPPLLLPFYLTLLLVPIIYFIFKIIKHTVN
ncbi:MAG TPA: DUF1648 domain-containing protein [Candidatus Pelethocola excrementipullorum]|nr:DUF1648 domain-containing protein [Candidatus Pelethocola excrementipullorum]